MRRLVVLAAVAVATGGVVAACGDGADAPATETAEPSADGSPADVTPEGLDRVRATVTEPDGEVCELCVWLADTAEARRRGLMFVTDLGDADGMAFVYPRPHTGRFWMRNTPLPLSIAFFDPDGVYLDDFDMAPCGSGRCDEFDTPEDFLIALEVLQGDLPELGVVPGSRLSLTDEPCP